MRSTLATSTGKPLNCGKLLSHALGCSGVSGFVWQPPSRFLVFSAGSKHDRQGLGVSLQSIEEAVTRQSQQTQRAQPVVPHLVRPCVKTEPRDWCCPTRSVIPCESFNGVKVNPSEAALRLTVGHTVTRT
jgi:hypothetical protein